MFSNRNEKSGFTLCSRKGGKEGKFQGGRRTDAVVSISEELMDAIFEGAKRLYPRETILLLRGKRKKNLITISGLVVPPLANYGRGYANIFLHMLPMDFSIIGTVHSHPSGNPTPSYTDLNHFLGVVLMIVAFPFVDDRNVTVYDRSGNRLELNVAKA
jgi:proteasome lid subunit RPN8/RPN11